MKRVMMVITVLMLWTSVGFAAENWEHFDSSDFYNEYHKITYHNEYSIDTNSIKRVQLGINEIIKAKVKVSNQVPNKYSIQQYWVNSDTKQWKLAFVEEYIDGTLASQLDYRHLQFYAYDGSKVIDEILRRAN